MTTTEPIAFPYDQNGELGLDVDPLFAKLRREEPLCRVQLAYGEPAWLVTRYEDAKSVLGDPRFSRAAAIAAGNDEPRHHAQVVPLGIMDLDLPEHTRLRRLASKALTGGRVMGLRPRAKEIADALVDAMLAGGPPADLVDDFACPLTITVFSELFGVPAQDRDQFRLWCDGFITDKAVPAEVAEHAASLFGYIGGLIAQRRENQGDDLLSVFVAARNNEDRLSEEETLSLAMVVLGAGYGSTTAQISDFAYTLLTRPDLMARLRADMELIPRAVEELMRYVPLGNGTLNARYALEDVELGGVTVRAGEAVVIHLTSANRNESAFSNPDEIDLGRDESPHVGFGHGAHHCLGAPLARMELQVALHTLLTRFSGLRLAGTRQDIQRRTGLTPGPSHMLVTWG